MQNWNELIKRMSDIGHVLIASARVFEIDFNADSFQSDLEIIIDDLKILLRAVRTKRIWDKQKVK